MMAERILKILIGLVTFTIVLVSLTFVFKNAFASTFAKSGDECILISPYKEIKYKVYGKVFEPNLALPVATQKGFRNVEFLVDSGAVVSTIPRSIGKEVFGGNMENLERTVLRGFGGGTTFGYVGVMRAKFGTEILNIPVVFSESNTTKAILGRKGFLENITTVLDDNGKHLCLKD